MTCHRHHPNRARYDAIPSNPTDKVVSKIRLCALVVDRLKSEFLFLSHRGTVQMNYLTMFQDEIKF
jgi:hypothetical protein